MRAVVAESPDGPAILVDKFPPRLRSNGYILVRTKAVALNPADAAILEYGMAPAGALLGCDYAGIVEEVSPGVHRHFKKGDRVCGPTRAADPKELKNGSAAEIICVKADMQLHVPEAMGWEEASTLGVTYLTTGRCVYQKFNLPWPDNPDPNPGYLLVYGGSSAMGTMVTQFAKLSNYSVVATASPRNFELCKSYGADHVFGYNDPKAPEQIRRLTENSLKLAMDCISTDGTATFCAQVLAEDAGAKYSSILFSKCPREDVESFQTIGYSFLGEEWEQMGVVNAASLEDFEYSKRFAELSEILLKEGSLRGHPVEVRAGGLAALPQGIEDLRQRKVSGKKIVVRVGDEK